MLESHYLKCTGTIIWQQTGYSYLTIVILHRVPTNKNVEKKNWNIFKMLMVVDSQQMQRLAGDVICLTKKKK